MHAHTRTYKTGRTTPLAVRCRRQLSSPDVSSPLPVFQELVMGRKRQWRCTQKDVSVLDSFHENMVPYFFAFVNTTPATLSMCINIASLSGVCKNFYKHALELKHNGNMFYYREGHFLFFQLSFRIVDPQYNWVQSVYPLPKDFFNRLAYLSSKPIKKHGIEGRYHWATLSDTTIMWYRHIRESIHHSWKLEIVFEKNGGLPVSETYYRLV